MSIEQKLGIVPALVVLSGGQDSVTCLARAIQQRGAENVHAVTFDYGQRHKLEVGCAIIIAGMAGIGDRHEIIAVPDILQGTSPLVNKQEQVEQYDGADDLPGGLEKTFVPMRNMLFLTLAANRAVVIAQKLGVDRVDLITGLSQEDFGGYPDCREPFVAAMQLAVHEAINSEELPLLQIVAPLMHLNKKETVEMSEATQGARRLLAYSHTCYRGAVPPCGRCHACILRAKGYAKAGVVDPLIERLAAT